MDVVLSTIIPLVILMIFPPVLLVAGVFLQIFLARSEPVWPGLILPGIFFLLSLLEPVLLLFSIGINGLLGALTAFLLANIPTAVLLAIYFACRSRNRKKRLNDLDRMNIQDLE